METWYLRLYHSDPEFSKVGRVLLTGSEKNVRVFKIEAFFDWWVSLEVSAMKYNADVGLQMDVPLGNDSFSKS